MPDANLLRSIGSLTREWLNIAVRNIIDHIYMADEKLFGVGKFTTLPTVGSGARGCLAYRAVDTLDDSLWIYHRNAAGGWSWQQILFMSSLLSVTNDIVPDEDWIRFLGGSTKAWWALYTHGLYSTPTDPDIWVGANLVADGVRDIGFDSYGSPDPFRDCWLDRYLRSGKVASLPAPAAEHRGKIIRTEGTEVGTGADEAWMEIWNGTAFVWKKITLA